MPYTQLFTTNANIYKCPTLDSTHQSLPGTQITMGDLHGNTMKLIYMLVSHGIITGISEETYQQLVDIYCQPLTKDRLDQFNQIVSTMTFCKGGKILLLGDELADRGRNDYLTLKIIEQLKRAGVDIEILISNHSLDFIESYETYQGDQRFYPHIMEKPFSNSLFQLGVLVSSGIVTADEVLGIINTCYKPMLRAISYSTNDSENGINIYSHAGIGTDTIRALAQQLGVAYTDQTIVELKGTIDRINQQFQAHVFNNTVHTLSTAKHFASDYDFNSNNHPFDCLTWNRCYKTIQRPATAFNYLIRYVHGHDLNDKADPDIVFILDNYLGKSEEDSQGEYAVLYQKKINLIPLSPLPSDFITHAKGLPEYAEIQRCAAAPMTYRKLPKLIRNYYLAAGAVYEQEYSNKTDVKYSNKMDIYNFITHLHSIATTLDENDDDDTLRIRVNTALTLLKKALGANYDAFSRYKAALQKIQPPPQSSSKPPRLQ